MHKTMQTRMELASFKYVIGIRKLINLEVSLAYELCYHCGSEKSSDLSNSILNLTPVNDCKGIRGFATQYLISSEIYIESL